MSEHDPQPNADTPDGTRAFYSPKQLAESTGIPLGTWAMRRSTGQGPRYFKIGRRVLYAREDVEAFIAAARQASPVGAE